MWTALIKRVAISRSRASQLGPKSPVVMPPGQRFRFLTPYGAQIPTHCSQAKENSGYAPHMVPKAPVGNSRGI